MDQINSEKKTKKIKSIALVYTALHDLVTAESCGPGSRLGAKAIWASPESFSASS